MKLFYCTGTSCVLVTFLFHYCRGFDAVESDFGRWRYDLPFVAPTPRSTYPYFVTASVPALHDALYKKIFQVILDQGLFFNSNASRNQSPFEFRTPEQLAQLIDFSLPETGVSHDELVSLTEKIFKYSPHTSHPFRVDRHSTGLDPHGVLGDWMATAMTVPMLTYKESPVFTLMEDELTQVIRQLIGYPGGEGDGIITAGSSIGNGYAIQMALQHKFPQWKHSGIRDGNVPPVAIFLSEEALFSYEKSCIWEGIGMSACIRVPADANGRMSIAELKNRIEDAKAQGRQPVMVIATAGTPVMGAIDPIEEIGKIAKTHGMWFHVDGQSGGSYFLSENLKSKLKGIENSDSYLWNPEKSLSLPAVAAVLVARRPLSFIKAFAFKATYLFQFTSLYDSETWDIGDKHMQTTRRPSIGKLWFVFKSKGQPRLAEHLEYTSYLLNYTVDYLKTMASTFTLVASEFDSNQVGFYYVPPALRTQPKHLQEEILAEEKFTERLKATLLLEGILSISVDTSRVQKNPFFVMSLRNSVLTKDDIEYMIAQIEYFGELTFLRNRSGTSQDVCSNGSILSETEPQLNLMNTCPKTDQIAVRSNTNTVPVPPPLSDYPDYVNSPVESLHKEKFQEFFNEDLKIGTYFEDKRASEHPLFFKAPAALLTLFDFSLTNSTGSSCPSELSLFRELVKYSAHNGHPYFDFHLVQALDAYGQMADYIVTALNSAIVTYEDNPVLTLMEDEVIKAVIKLVGYPENRGSGLILPGGSASNQIALLLAMAKKSKQFKLEGHQSVNKTFVAFLSNQAHYATNKGAFFAGIGLNNAVYVKPDVRGRMDPKDLERKILQAKQEGKLPFFVIATAGTTVLGAVDPINEIADLAEKYDLWLHVDGTYGGSTLFSNDANRQGTLRGLERGDSFTFNAHKALAASRLVTCFVTKHATILNQVAPPPSSQEFNNRILYNGLEFDRGITQLFPDRRASVLKLWFMWKAKGRKGLGDHIDYGFNLMARTYQYLLSMNDTFALAHPGFPPELTSVNFYYLPTRYRGRELTESLLNELGRIQVKIDDALIGDNSEYISSEASIGVQNTLILSLYNSALTFEDIQYMLKVVDHHGKDL